MFIVQTKLCILLPRFAEVLLYTPRLTLFLCNLKFYPKEREKLLSSILRI